MKVLTKLEILFIILQQIGYVIIYIPLFLISNILVITILSSYFFRSTLTERRLKEIYINYMSVLKEIL